MKSDTKKFGDTPNTQTPSFEDVSRRAYELWEKDGRPEGNEQQHWYQAEKELSQGGNRSRPIPSQSAGSAPSSPGPIPTSSKQPAKASAGRL